MKSVGDYDLSRRKTMDSLWLDGQKSGPGSEKKKTFISFSGLLRVNKKNCYKSGTSQNQGGLWSVTWKNNRQYLVSGPGTGSDILLLLFHEFFFYQSSLDNSSLTSIFISISHLHEINKCLTLKISWRLKCEVGGNQKLFPFLFNLLNLELHHFMIWHGNFAK